MKELLAIYPGIRFKLDASDKWTDDVVAELAATGAVDVVDFEGLYDGDWVEATPSAELYGRVAAAFPQAWLEDARINDETRPALEPHHDRLTWDFPIHSVDDVEALEMAAALPQLEAVALRERAAALRLLRPLRGERDRGLRRRPVRARAGTRPDPAPRVPLPPRGCRTTSPRRSTTRAARGRACRRARCRPPRPIQASARPRRLGDVEGRQDSERTTARGVGNSR